MSIVQSIILGIIQGLTEFLPVSSSGHLVIAQELMGFVEPPLLFDTLIHVGTLVAVIFYFRHDIVKLKWADLKLLAIGTFPAVVVGFLLKDYVDEIFTSIIGVAAGLFLTSSFLFRTKNLTQGERAITPKTALLIGIFQAIAILPGVSRSGSTVAAALLVGLSQPQAFKFSFLLAIPAILGATVLQLVDLENIAQYQWSVGIWGALTAAFVGFVSLVILKKLMSQSKIYYFGYYTLSLSILLVIYTLIEPYL